MRLKIAILSGVLLLMAACGFFYVKGTPYYSIYQLGRAVAHRDADAALKYVDVDSVTESLVQNLLLNAGAPSHVDKGMKAAISMNMPSIKEGVRTYLITAIRAGEGPVQGREGLPFRSVVLVYPISGWLPSGALG